MLEALSQEAHDTFEEGGEDGTETGFQWQHKQNSFHEKYQKSMRLKQYFHFNLIIIEKQQRVTDIN